MNHFITSPYFCSSLIVFSLGCQQGGGELLDLKEDLILQSVIDEEVMNVGQGYEILDLTWILFAPVYFDYGVIVWFLSPQGHTNIAYTDVIAANYEVRPAGHAWGIELPLGDGDGRNVMAPSINISFGALAEQSLEAMYDETFNIVFHDELEIALDCDGLYKNTDFSVGYTRNGRPRVMNFAFEYRCRPRAAVQQGSCVIRARSGY